MSILRMVRGTPNPRGAAGAELFVFQGEVTGPVDHIVCDVELPARRTGGREFHLRVLHINDLHGHISHVTADADDPILSRIVSRVRAAREADDAGSATLFLSGGDDLIGAAFEELLCDPSRPRPCNSAYRLYSEAGLDAAVLGNHELDVGTSLLAHSIHRDAHFPVLCGNLTHCPRLARTVFPAALWVVRGVRIGIVGVMTPAEVLHRDDSQFVIAHPGPAAGHLVRAIRPLCDVLILLTHVGHALGAKTAVTSAAGDYELAQSLPAGLCDLIVGGHTHVALNSQAIDGANIVNGIPIVQAGAFGEWLGQVDLVLGPHPARVTAHLMPVSALPVDAGFEAAHVQPLVKRVRALLSEGLGSVDRGAGDAGCSAPESALANFIADAIVARCRRAGFDVDLAMVEDATMATDLPAGVLTFADWFNVMPHGDVIRLYALRGDQLQSLLDDNARRAARAAQGVAHFSQAVRYQMAPDGARAIRVNDLPLDDQRSRTFTLACSSFTRQRDGEWEERARAEGCEAFALQTLANHDTSLRLRDEMVAQIRAGGGISMRCDGRVSIQRADGL